MGHRFQGACPEEIRKGNFLICFPFFSLGEHPEHAIQHFTFHRSMYERIISNERCWLFLLFSVHFFPQYHWRLQGLCVSDARGAKARHSDGGAVRFPRNAGIVLALVFGGRPWQLVVSASATFPYRQPVRLFSEGREVYTDARL